MNIRRTALRQAAAFGFAAAVTLAVLGSVDRLATQPAADALLAQSAAPAQVVVIEARRGAQS